MCCDVMCECPVLLGMTSTNIEVIQNWLKKPNVKKFEMSSLCNYICF